MNDKEKSGADSRCLRRFHLIKLLYSDRQALENSRPRSDSAARVHSPINLYTFMGSKMDLLKRNISQRAKGVNN